MGDLLELKKKLQEQSALREAHQRQSEELAQAALESWESNLVSLLKQKQSILADYMESQMSTISSQVGEIDSSLQSIRSSATQGVAAIQQIDQEIGATAQLMASEVRQRAAKAVQTEMESWAKAIKTEMESWAKALVANRKSLERDQQQWQRTVLADMRNGTRTLTAGLQTEISDYQAAYQSTQRQMEAQQEKWQDDGDRIRRRVNDSRQELQELETRVISAYRRIRWATGAAVLIVIMALGFGKWQDWKTDEKAQAVAQLEQQILGRHQEAIAYINANEWAQLAVGSEVKGQWWVRVQPDSCARNTTTNEWWAPIQ